MVSAPRSVLAATDFSPHGDATVAWACGLAAEGGRVHFVHVVDKELYPSPLYAHYSPGVKPTPEQREAQRAELEARMRALVPATAGERVVTVEVEILEGDSVAAALCGRADGIDAGIIVLGSHRRSLLAEALLGSVENAVLRKSGRAVLLVPAP